jgi:creatinine amidohydrolase
MDTSVLALEELTWTEVKERTDAGVDTVIVPVAAVEQHGPHLPLATDAIIGERVSERVAEELGDALVAPVVRPGVSPIHADFPGSLSVPPEVLMDTLRATVGSLVDGGFDTVALLPSHGGNFPSVEAIVPDIARDLSEANVFVVGTLQRYMRLLNEGSGNALDDYEEPVVHAGATETSLMLAIDESAVREDALQAGYDGEIASSTLFRDGIDHYDDGGVLGDPTRASRAAGEQILDTITEAYVAEIERER